MRLLLLSIVCLFVTVQYSRSCRAKSCANINAGVGILSTFLMDGGTAKVLPLALSADYKFKNNFSLGFFAGYSSSVSDLEEMPDGEFA